MLRGCLGGYCASVCRWPRAAIQRWGWCLGGYGVLWWVGLRLSRRGLSDMILWLVLIAVTLHAVYGMVESTSISISTEIVKDDFDGPANAGFVNRTISPPSSALVRSSHWF